MAVENIRGNSSLNRIGIIDASTEEIFYVGIVNLPLHITVNLLLPRSG